MHLPPVIFALVLATSSAFAGTVRLPLRIAGDSPTAPVLARVTASRLGLEAIHVIAHGRPGEVNFTAGALTLENVESEAAELSGLGTVLGAN